MNIVAVNVANVQQKDNVIREVFNNILDNVSNKHDQCKIMAWEWSDEIIEYDPPLSSQARLSVAGSK